MKEALLPAAGWYADGSTVGVHRWFDGTAWTEHTRPDTTGPDIPHPRGVVAQTGSSPLSPDSRFATDVPFGNDLTARNGLAMSPEDLAARDAAFRLHRIADACRVRRGAIGAFCSALVLVAVTSGISLALQSPSELWLAGGAGAAFLVWRAARDYGRAVFREAPRLSPGWRVLGAVGLVAAIGLFVAVPVVAAQHASAELDGITDLTKLPGLTDPTTLPGLPDLQGLTDPTG